MDGLCGIDPDDSSIEERMLQFLSDRSSYMVTGIRRMGRDPTVDYMKQLCDEHDLNCTIYPTVTGDIIIVRDWRDVGDLIEDILRTNPDADILFGQDLCHQVPAIVRYNCKE